MLDGKRKETAILEVGSIARNHRRNEAATGGLPKNLQTSSEHVWFDLSSQKKSSGRSSLPTWYNVVFSCLSWSTKTLHCAYSDRRNYCWLC